jgi:hypothetical protein
MNTVIRDIVNRQTQNKKALNDTITRLIAMGASLEQLQTWTREACEGYDPHLIQQELADLKAVWNNIHN